MGAATSAPDGAYVISFSVIAGRCTIGFRDVVSRVCLGEVGAIFGIEASRLARSSADLSRLLELARLTDTLLIDGDGVYDLADFNDRLLPGLKGTMSEAELHFLPVSCRAPNAQPPNVASCGSRCRSATSTTTRAPSSSTRTGVQAAVADVFAAFRATGSAYGMASAFKGRRYPNVLVSSTNSAVA